MYVTSGEHPQADTVHGSGRGLPGEAGQDRGGEAPEKDPGSL